MNEKIKKEKQKIPIKTEIPPEWVKKIDEIRESVGLSYADIVRLALKEFLKKKDKELEGEEFEEILEYGSKKE